MSTENGVEIAKQTTPMSDKELQFCSYLEQVFLLRSHIPTYEIVANALGLTGRDEYNDLLGNVRVRTYLKGIGLDLDSIQRDNRNALSPLQLLTINSLLDFNTPEPDHKKLKKLGVTGKQFAAWKSDPAFATYFKERIDKIFSEDTGEIDRALFERARDGDIAAIKFYNEITGRYRPANATGNTAVDISLILIRIQEILLRHLHQDPELLQVIGLELEAVANSAGLVYSSTKPVGRSIPGEISEIT